MADEVPISRDITDVPIVSSNLDKPENADLREAFASWEPAPVEEVAPPSAPVEKPEETVEASETMTATKPETDPNPVEPEKLDEPRGKERDFERRVKRVPTEKEISGEVEGLVHEADEIEALELDKNASSSQKGQFRQLKEITKKFRTEATELKAKLAPVLQELGVSGDDPVALDTLAEKVKALSAENTYRCRWNCLVSSSLADHRMMPAIMALECLWSHETKLEKRREAKATEIRALRRARGSDSALARKDRFHFCIRVGVTWSREILWTRLSHSARPPW